MTLHKHDTSTFLHLQADMLTPQRRERARLGRGGRLKARHGTAPPDIRRCAGRCEAYNHLNMKLLGVLQMLYKWVA